MNGKNSYWMVGDASPNPSSPSPSTTPDSSPAIDRNLYLTAPKARRPQTFIAIHPNSNISWMPPPPEHGSVNPVATGSTLKLALSYKNMPTTSADGSHRVSSVQHVPPTHNYNVNGTILQDINSTNTLVSSSTNNSELPEIPSEPCNFRDDIELDDKALVTISTKELNRRLKKKGLGQIRQLEIKLLKRTLKNRGYASNSRVKREDETKRLEKDIVNLEAELKTYPLLEHLQKEYTQLKGDVREIKDMMNLSDSSDESLPDEPIMEDVKEEHDEDEYTSSDDENDENDE